MDKRPAFQQTQFAFTAHIRQPDANPKPADIEARRMAIYRELLFNNINAFLQNGFPVLRSLYDETQWHALVRNFFANHRSQTPYFSEISKEFLYFLETEYQPTDIDPPFMLELAHYEWVELALMIAPEKAPETPINPHGDLLAECPVLSPQAWLLAYQWPVHRISQTFQPDTHSDTPNHLIVYRNKEDNVKFIEANPVTARLFRLIESNSNQSGKALLEQIATELQHPNPELVIDGGHQILVRFYKLGIVPGTRVRQQQ